MRTKFIIKIITPKTVSYFCRKGKTTLISAMKRNDKDIKKFLDRDKAKMVAKEIKTKNPRYRYRIEPLNYETL